MLPLQGLTGMALVAGFELDDQVRVLSHHIHDALLHLERQLPELRIVFAFIARFVIATNLNKKNVWNPMFETGDQLDQLESNNLLVCQKQLVKSSGS